MNIPVLALAQEGSLLEVELGFVILLAIAVKRASDANVDAGSSVRRGDVLEEIRQFLVDKDADLLLLGAPRGTNALVMGDDAVEQLAMAIEAASAIPFEIVRPDQVTA